MSFMQMGEELTSIIQRQKMPRHKLRVNIEQLYSELQGEKINAFLTGKRTQYLEKRKQYINIVNKSGSRKKVNQILNEIKIEKLIKKSRNYIKKQIDKDIMTNPITSANCIRSLILLASKTVLESAHHQKKYILKADTIFRPDALRIRNQFNQLETIDSYITSSFEAGSLTLKMLSYKHKWIQKDGSIIIPDAVLDDHQLDVGEIKRIGYWAKMWDCTDYLNQLLATNECKIKTKTFHKNNRGLLRVSLITSQEGDESYRLQSIDAERLEDLENSSLFYLTEMLPPAQMSGTKRNMLLALLYFEHILFVDLEKQYSKINNLSIKDLIFGYAAFQAIANDSKQNSIFIHLKEGMIEKYLLEYDVPKDKINIIIDLFSYNRTSKDFFDSPIIHVSGNKKFLIRMAAATSNIRKVILSIISTLKINIEHKGKAFEKNVLNFFNFKKIPNFSFEIKSKSGQYEFDVICYWKNILWIFECKNRGTTELDPISAYFSKKQEKEAIDQVIRQKKFLDNNRNIIVDKFGESARNAFIIPCILYALPHSRGLQNGVNIYDFVALQRLFSGSSIDYTLRSGKQGKYSTRHTEEKVAAYLWTGGDIDWIDLAIQMKLPIQNFVAARQYTSNTSLLPLSPYLLLAHNLYIRRGPDHAYTMAIIKDYSNRLKQIRKTLGFAEKFTLSD